MNLLYVWQNWLTVTGSKPMIFLIVLKRLQRNLSNANRQLFFHILTHHWEQLLQPCHDWKFFLLKSLSVKSPHKCIQIMSWLICRFLCGFNMNTWTKNTITVHEQLPISHSSMSSPIVFDCVNNKYYFPPLNDSNTFSTVDYDASINMNMDYSINHETISKTTKELIKLRHISDLERKQWLTLITMSVRNPQLAGYLSAGNRRSFLCRGPHRMVQWLSSSSPTSVWSSYLLWLYNNIISRHCGVFWP